MKLGEIRADEASLKRNKKELLDAIRIPAGHLLSVIVEEMGIEKPDVKKMIRDWNAYVFRYGIILDIKSPTDTVVYASSKQIFGLFDYLRQIREELNLDEDTYRRVRTRLEDEIKGVIPEDRIFERKRHPFTD